MERPHGEFRYDASTDTEMGDIRLSAPDHRDLLMAAGVASVVAADHLRRHYGDSDLAAMFDTAGRFTNDVLRVDTVIEGAEERDEDYTPSPAKGQVADLILLEMAALWMSVERKDGDDFKDAALFLRDVRTGLNTDPAADPHEVADSKKGEHRYSEHREYR
jgi:hypothetical protein